MITGTEMWRDEIPMKKVFRLPDAFSCSVTFTITSLFFCCIAALILRVYANYVFSKGFRERW